MAEYTAIQWIFFFFVYCLVGWIWETCYVSAKQHRFVNRGFLRGPFLPIYGSGGIIMLFAAIPCKGNLVLTFLSGMFAATLLELVTGELMLRIFKVRYWDYTPKRFNYRGHICLSSSIAWGVATLFINLVLHKAVSGVVLKIPEHVLTVITDLLMAGFLVDLSLSVKAAIDLRNILVRMEAARAEMGRLQKRLDVVIALGSQDIEQMKESLSQKLDELNQKVDDITDRTQESWENWKAETEQKMNLLKDRYREALPTESIQKMRDEMTESQLRFRRMLEEHDRMSSVKDFLVRSMVRGNPNMTTTDRYREFLEEIQKKTGQPGKKK